VVVPFRGTAGELRGVRERLAELRLGPDDTVAIVDNSRNGDRSRVGSDVVAAPELQTPGFARNRGAERGRSEWLVFLDADILPTASLVDDYFDPVPEEGIGLLAGGVRDEPAGPGSGPAARYSHLRGSMSQDMTLQHGEWGFVQTANCALRRRAFEAVGGFREEIRAGEDADLCYRLRAAGWGIDRRENAVALHRSRATVHALLIQKACHGSAAGWLNARYPGSFPARRLPGLTWWGVRRAVSGLFCAARDRRRDEALFAVMDPLTTLAYEVGRSLPNHRPLRGRP